jgi:hypothetical protein
MYKLTNLKTGETMTYENLWEAEMIRKACIMMNNDHGMKPRDTKKNYLIEKI